MNNFLQKYKNSAHVISGAIVSAVGVYISVPEVKSAVDVFLTNHKSLSALLGAAVAIVLKYSNSTKPSTQDAEQLKASAAKAV